MGGALLGICGPTASGKTAVAVEICKQIGGEVVSADSMQIYRGMDILTAKPSDAETRGIPHHMIGVVNPAQKFTASDYREMANAAVEEIRGRGRAPVLCGGTGLYIDALTRGMRFSEKADEALREALKRAAAQPGGAEALHAELQKIDPASAQKYPAADVRRVIRSIEIYRLTGMTREEQARADALLPDAYDARLFAIDWPRDRLYARIDHRVDEMVSRGLISEVASLMKAGESAFPTAAQAIGYKEIASALRGDCAMSDAIQTVKTASRNYAKRQITWFRRDTRVTWVEARDKSAEALAREILDRYLDTITEAHI